MSGSMRDAMPQCAAWIDDLRAEFGREYIDTCIRNGLARGTFHAEENGQTIGRLVDWTGATLAHMPEDFHGSLPALPHRERKARGILLVTGRGDWFKQVKR